MLLGTLHLFSFDVDKKNGTFLWIFWGTIKFINGKQERKYKITKAARIMQPFLETPSEIMN